MSEIDLLNDLLTSNPNLPAAKGEIMLLRLETKSEFKQLRTELDHRFKQIDLRFGQIDNTLEDLKLAVTGLTQQGNSLVQQVAGLTQQGNSMAQQISGISQQVALLVERSVSR